MEKLEQAKSIAAAAAAKAKEDRQVEKEQRTLKKQEDEAKLHKKVYIFRL